MSRRTLRSYLTHAFYIITTVKNESEQLIYAKSETSREYTAYLVNLNCIPFRFFRQLFGLPKKTIEISCLVVLLEVGY